MARPTTLPPKRPRPKKPRPKRPRPKKPRPKKPRPRRLAPTRQLPRSWGSPTAEETAEAGADPDAAGGEEGEAAEEAEEAEDAPAPYQPPWRNSFFTYTNQGTFNSFIRDAQLSYNPSWSMLFTVNPRWYVAPTTFFWASAGLSIELTDTNTNALNREPLLNDTLIEIRHMIPWEGFVFMGAARIGIPTSRLSLAANRYIQTGLGLTIVRPIPEAKLTLAGVFAYRRWWAGSNVVQVGTPQPDRCPPPPPIQGTAGGISPMINTATCDQLGTASAGRDIILAGISATATPIGAFSINLSVFFLSLYGFELAPAYVEVETSPQPLRIDDGSPTHWRNFTYIALSVAYQFLPWLNVSLGVQNAGIVASAYNPDGSIRNPIFTPDTQVFLSATIGLDSLWGEIAGGGDDGLTPEERQRRQQGLARNNSGVGSGGVF